jgi:hypothetical protein
MKRRPLEERFWEKVEKSEGCWLWTAAHNGVGYGVIGTGAKNRSRLAHRFSYELANGPIPEKTWVLHKCDNPGCVNPEHLFLGNNTSNVRDMHSKGRGWGGMGPEKAYEILWRWASGENRRKIAADCGVSLHVVKDIAQRRSWQSLSQLHD